MDASSPLRASTGASRPESTVAGREHYKRFPPRWGGLYLPVSCRDLALAGLAMYPACRPSAQWALRLTRRWVRLFGPKALPGRSRRWVPPLEWEALEESWRQELGEFDGITIYQRVPSTRPGLAALIALGGEPIAFVKARRGDAALARERDALAAVDRYGPSSFLAPRPIGFGSIGSWTWCAQSPVIDGSNRPPGSPDLDRILAEIQSALSDLPAADSVPEHWRPMHGDFTPWNLRALEDGEGLVLVDWEDAGWGPPGADEVLYRAVETALGRSGTTPSEGIREAIDFWRREIRSWGRTGRDERLAQEVLTTLAEWDESGKSES